MTLEQSIKTAIEFEKKVYRTYQEAGKKATVPAGKKVFEVLAQEEKGHMDYLQSRLGKWQKSGHLRLEILKTAIPNQAQIKEGLKKLNKRTKGGQVRHAEVELLRQALQMEQETSAFYRQMTAELEDEGRKLFSRFVEIEEGHLAIVQAEIDSVTGLGFWFDIQEFKLEEG